MASGLLVDPIRLRALPGQILPDRPRPRPRRRILDRDDVVDHVLVDTGPPFDEAQVLARPLPIRFRTEVGHVDDERIAFPVCAGITRPLADVPGKVWPIAHGNDALPSLALTRVVEDRDGVTRLDDFLEQADNPAKIRQGGSHAPLAHAPVFRAVHAVDIARHVVGRGLEPSW